MKATCSILCACLLVLLQTDLVFMNSSPPPINNDQTSSPPPSPSPNTDNPPKTQPSDEYEAPTSPAPPVSPPPPQKETNIPQSKDTVQNPPAPASKPNTISPPNNPGNVTPKPPPVAEVPDVETQAHLGVGGVPDKADSGDCSADNIEGCSETTSVPPKQCTWTSKEGITYSLEDFNRKQFRSNLPNPKGSVLVFQLCPHDTLNPLVLCNNQKAPTCLTVPGIKPTVAGALSRVEQIEPNIPGHGFKLVYDEGETCEITKAPRKTIIKFPCNPSINYQPEQMNPRKTWEGQKNEVCNYFVEFPPSKFGCPVSSADVSVPSSTLTSALSLIFKGQTELPRLWAVTGCTDSVPLRSTSECHNIAKIQVTLHGLNFDKFCMPTNPHDGSPTQQQLPPFNSAQCTSTFRRNHVIMIGTAKCSTITILTPYQINCSIEKVKGKGLPVAITRYFSNGTKAVISELGGVVSFKDTINFREKFEKFVDLGVGGLKREINELYRRAFASRSTSPEVLEKLGIGHIKGILLYGPPGSGKTLLARTIGKILGTKQVQLINGPEIINKYLGESERNLRACFKEPQDAWKKHGAMSDLYVIVIDEIDAICKPRGKTDGSSAGVAYDAIVNQLLTLMDGLNEVHNTLVIGMTNRRELLDSALLRPGRFEVQIEVGLPDEEGRKEIFDIHTRTMRESNMLSLDVNLHELAANTSRFSGAEIAGVVRAAASYALDRFQTSNSLESDEQSEDYDVNDSVIVTSADFQHAIQSVVPAYTHSETQVVSYYLPQGYLPCGDAHDAIIDESLDLIHALKQSSTTRIQSLLLYGPRGSGKTAIAAHLAMIGKFSYVKIISASSLVGRHDIVKVDILHQSFNDAYKYWARITDNNALQIIGQNQVLTVPSASLTDGGQYACIATNSRDNVRRVIEVTVVEITEPPTEVITSEASTVMEDRNVTESQSGRNTRPETEVGFYIGVAVTAFVCLVLTVTTIIAVIIWAVFRNRNPQVYPEDQYEESVVMEPLGTYEDQQPVVVPWPQPESKKRRKF